MTFVVLSKSARKISFFLEIFRSIGIHGKIKFNYSIFFSLESRDQWTLMLKKFYWPLLYCRNPREIFFFYQNFSTNQNLRNIKFNYSIFCLIGIERPMNTDAKKILLTFVVLSKSARKIFFLSKFFDQSEFEKKSNSIIRLFCHSNRETNEHWCLKNSIDLCCIVEIREKKFFFIKIFRPIRISEKIKLNSSTFSRLESRDQWTLMRR